MQLACVVDICLSDPVDFVLTVKVQREVKRQTALAYCSTLHDTAPMYII